MWINLAHLLSIPILWLGLVFGPYLLFTVGFKAKSPSAVVRVLYGVYFIALFFYTMLFSPLSRLIYLGSPWFFVGLSILGLMIILLIITGLLRKAKRGGN